MYCDWPSVGRCCFCLPLRKGVLAFGYVNLIYSAFWVGLYSFAVHTDEIMFPLYRGSSMSMSQDLCIFLYCVEMVFNVLLIYGTHQRKLPYIKAYYYFSISTIVAIPLMQVIDLLSGLGAYENAILNVIEIGPLIFAAMFINIYLLIVVRSLLKKMELGAEHQLVNPLQQIVYDGKLPGNNGVYNEIVLPANV